MLVGVVVVVVMGVVSLVMAVMVVATACNINFTHSLVPRSVNEAPRPSKEDWTGRVTTRGEREVQKRGNTMNNTNDALGGIAFTTTPTPGEWRHVGEDEMIRVVQVVNYWVLTPVVVAVGVAVNAFGLYLLRKPRLRVLPSIAYFKLLLSLDVAVLLLSITTIVTLNGCQIHSYLTALYLVHPFFSVYYMLETFSHYVMVWVSYNRFLGLWYFHLFQHAKQPSVMRRRVAFTALFCVALHLRHLLDVQVVCVNDVGGVKATNHTEGCEGGAWMIEDSLHRAEAGDVWHDVDLAARGVLGMIVPMVLVLVFNSGFVVGTVRHRLHNIAATERTRQEAYSTIYITLAFSLSFVTAIMTRIAYLILYSRNAMHCHGTFCEEVFRGASHFLLRFDHLMRILFLSINLTFRAELRTFLQDTKNYLKKRLHGDGTDCLPLTKATLPDAQY